MREISASTAGTNGRSFPSFTHPARQIDLQREPSGTLLSTEGSTVAVNTSKGIVRFEAFELDLRAGELRKDGTKPVRLSEQPFQILTMLLEHSGEVVSREEIRMRLWPNDTIVEFEHSISAAMNRLRQALGDSADNPRYIETLARRGYRLLVSVEWAGGGAADIRAYLKRDADSARTAATAPGLDSAQQATEGAIIAPRP